MPADANWLWSTVARLSATFVAIVGGFLASRVLAASQERKILEQQASGLAARVRVINQEQDNLNGSLIREDALAWLEEGIELIVGTWAEISLDEAVAEHPWERRIEELRLKFDRAAELTRRRHQEFSPMFVEGEQPPPDLEELIELKQLDDVDLMATWMVYKRLTNEFAQKPSMWLTIPFSQPKKRDVPRAVLIESRQVRRESESRLQDLRSEARILTAQLQQALDALASTGVVREAWWGFAVLVFFTLTGIVPSLWMMSSITQKMTPANAYVVVGLFALGLIALLGYLGVLIATVGRRPDRSLREMFPQIDYD